MLRSRKRRLPPKPPEPAGPEHLPHQTPLAEEAPLD
jgi:hypothetical protein